MSMKKREVAVITMHPDYGYEAVETQHELALVPANSTLLYEAELINFVKMGNFKLLYIQSRNGGLGCQR